MQTAIMGTTTAKIIVQTMDVKNIIDVTNRTGFRISLQYDLGPEKKHVLYFIYKILRHDSY